MKLQFSTALVWILVSLAGCAQISFAQGRGTATERAITGDLSDALSANEWALVKIFNTNGVEQLDWPRSSAFRDPSVSLKFARSGHVFGNICNAITWRYSLIGGDRIKVSQVFMTYGACDDDAVMRLESRASRQISSASKAQIDADHDGTSRLTLRTSDDSRLVFSGQPAKAN